jgi:dihydropteroate synthase
MKITHIYIIALTFTIAIIGCSTEPPSVRVSNERSDKANVQIKTINNTINQNDITAGSTTNYQEVAEGSIEATASIQNESDSPTTTFNATTDNNYTIVIVNSNPPTIRVDTSSK